MAVVQLDQRIFKHDAQGSGFEPSTHVDLGVDFKRFIIPEGNSYILEGIRGTGKTHILKMIVNEIERDFQKYRIIPSLVTIAGAPEISKKDPKYFRIYLYTSIIKSVCKFINVKKESIIGESNPNFIKKLKELFLIETRQEDVSSNIEYLLNIANNIINDLYDNPDRIIKKLNLTETTGFKLGIESSPLSASMSGSQGISDEQVKEYTAQKLSDIYGIDVLLSFLRLVRALLNINYTYLLLDECSESNEMMQKEVFRLCKQVRACCSNNETLNRPDVAFVVAVYPPQKTFYPATNRGDDFNFQPGHDCSPEYLEIDELNEEFESFFLQLIENRLKLNNGGPHQISDVFDGREAVLIAAYSSGGVPRRFLEIIKQAHSQLSRDFANKKTETPQKINSSYVLSAIGQVVESSSILNDSTLSDADKIVLEKIIKKFAHRNKTIETKNKGVTVDEQKTPITLYFTTAVKSAGELGGLISIGIVHDKKRSRSRKSSIAAWQGSGILCSVDIGVAIHRGVIPRTSTRILEVCQKDLKLAASRGFSYALDVRLEEESLDIEIEQIKEYIQFLERRLLDLDKAFMEKSLPETAYNNMLQRTTSMLEAQRKNYERLKQQVEQRKQQEPTQ